MMTQKMSIVPPVTCGIHLWPSNYGEPRMTVMMGFSYTSDDGLAACRTLGEVYRFDEALNIVCPSVCRRHKQLESSVVSGETEAGIRKIASRAVAEIDRILTQPYPNGDILMQEYQAPLEMAIIREITQFRDETNILYDSQIPDAWAAVRARKAQA